MIKFLQLNPTGRWSWGRSPTIPLDGLGTVLLQGRNLDRGPDVRIGAGKSSLFNALCDILFGESASRLRGDAVVNSVWGRGAWGLVVFEDADGRRWRVISCRKWRAADPYPDQDVESQPSQVHDSGKRYSGTEVFVERWDDKLGKWMDERPTNEGGTAQLRQRLCYDKIASILGTNFRQFMATSYVCQKRTSQFLSGTHKDRLAILSELVDLSIWDRAVARARELAAGSAQDMTRAETKVALYRHDLERLQIPTEEEIYELDVELERAEEAVASTAARLDSLMQEQAVLTAELSGDPGEDRALRKSHNEAAARVTQADYELRNGASAFIGRRGEAQAGVSTAELDAARGELQDAQRAVAAARAHMNTLLEGEGQCPRCWQQVSQAHLDRERRLAGEELLKLQKRQLEAESRVAAASAAYEARVKAALDAVDREEREWREEASRRLSEAQEALAAIEAAQAASEAKREEGRARLAQLQSEITQYRNLSTEAANRLATLRRRADAISATLDRESELREALQQAEKELAEATELSTYYRALERMFGDKGIKAYQMGRLVDQLNERLASYMEILTDGAAVAWVDAFRTKKDGDITADVSIHVREGAKESVPVEGYSGGEQEQIAMALTCALLSLAMSNGTGSNILLLDEAFTALDEHSVGLAMSLIDTIRAGRVTTVFVVSHDPKIMNIANISRVWTCIKQEGVTRLQTEQ